MLGTLRKSLSKLRARRLKIGGGKGGFIVLDFTGDYIKLPNGDIIRKNDIINFDSNTLIYRTPAGELKTLTIDSSQEGEEERLVQALLEKLAKTKNRSHIVLHI